MQHHIVPYLTDRHKIEHCDILQPNFQPSSISAAGVSLTDGAIHSIHTPRIATKKAIALQPASQYASMHSSRALTAQITTALFSSLYCTSTKRQSGPLFISAVCVCVPITWILPWLPISYKPTTSASLHTHTPTIHPSLAVKYRAHHSI